MIKLRSFFKSFGSKRVLRSLDMDVDSGEIVVLRGKNGSGKTTLMRSICTLDRPDDYDYADIDEFDLLSYAEEVRSRTGYLSHNPPFYPELTGFENLQFWLRLNSLDFPDSKINELLAKVGLVMFSDDIAGNYSRGMIQRLGFAISISHSPTTLLLDEPFTGLDDEGSEIIKEQLLKMKEEGCSILLSSHDPVKFSDRTLTLDEGALS